jgi:hypothetical protein
MDNLRKLIELHCDLVGPEFLARSKSEFHLNQLPKTYLDTLRIANGFVLKNGYFRVFGTERLDGLVNVYDWNASSWKQEYREILRGVFIIAEDIFGDQYGFLCNERGEMRLVKVFCEGGEIEEQDGDFISFLRNRILSNQPLAFDFDLANDAWQAGLMPKLDEHLAFRLPLVSGGDYDLSNLQVETVALHLGMLGQMTLKNKSLPEGTKISGFPSSS